MLSVSTQLAVGEDLAQFEAVLKSIESVDEIRVYNFGRIDAEFYAICKNYSAVVIELKKPLPKIVEYIRADEIKSAKHDWVLVLDYDELIPAPLFSEILKIAKQANFTHSTYAMPRRNFSLGYPMRHGGFGDDHVIRLFYKPNFIDWPKEIHSTPRFKGTLGMLNNYLEHHKDASLAQMIQKTDRYTTVEAKQFFDGGVGPVSSLTLFRKTLMEFIRRYFFKLGLLDGPIGLLQSLYQSYSIFLRYAKLYELQKQKAKS